MKGFFCVFLKRCFFGKTNLVSVYGVWEGGGLVVVEGGKVRYLLLHCRT